MSTPPRYLTKSRFKLACTCPTKLFYTHKPEYADGSEGDSFLQALADGGYQVGELAKYYMPGGTEVKTLDYDKALDETEALLKQDQVLIYEAALRFENLFVRVDILKKSGKKLEIYEVKSKTFEPSETSIFWNKGTKEKRGLKGGWREYLEDVAFQKYVALKGMPKMQVSAFLMLVDKTAICETEGLNQKFLVKKDAKGRKGIQVMPSLKPKDLEGPQLIQAINVDGECAYLYSEEADEQGLDFEGRVKLFSESYASDKKITPIISTACKGCEFVASPEEMKQGLKNGRLECWKSQLKGWTDAEIMGPTVLDIWNFKGKKKLIEDKRLRLPEVTEDDFNMKPGDRGLSNSERQWLQVEKAQQKDESILFDRAGMAAEMAAWKFPLHFIDFETCAVALPFHKGRRPYEAVAFQYSHHMVHQDGRIEHKDQYLNANRGEFPNYDFLRALKKSLSTDEGTIFRYATHENTYLNHIHKQLEEDSSVPDSAALLTFIKTITKSSSSVTENPWEGKRSMVDMLELVRRYYYAPDTQGSNSIKYILPATLRASEFLKAKYSKPVYGTKGIPSLNFKDMIWVKKIDGQIQDPYSLLPPVFKDIDQKAVELLSDAEDELKEGGAAMAAYGRLQFEEMGELERKAIQLALLKYCELDTLAMVMIYEAWREWCK